MVDNLNDEIFVKYLEMIQRVIERMAKNSFQIKTWTATLFAAIIILTYSIINILIFIVLFFIISMFWALDSYYLKRERLFRKLYERKVKEFNENSKKIQELFTMNVKSYESEVNSIPRLMISTSEILYYIAFIIIIFVFLLVYLTTN
ncbi:hypothetical protein ES703_71615 [subsurface metagenome]